jgi:putative protease
MKQPELLSPAGSLKNMRFAFAYGADAVYAGQPRYSLRVRNNEFSKLEKIGQGIQEAHALGKKFFLASNLQPHNDKVRSYLRDLEPVIAMKPDALIMSDPGLIMMVRERWPEQSIHLSVQANAVNYASVRFWQKQGLERVILSRELSLDEVEEIRQRCPDIELEVFVHGALCIAYSGRCLLSGYITHRDSNQGACTNTCRWKYSTWEASEDEKGDVIPVRNLDAPTGVVDPGEMNEKAFLLEEERRPGELMPAFEDEHGTYIMNSKDLRAVQHVRRLMEIGVDSLKIEGRTKSHYYVARTAQIYRSAIEAALRGQDCDFDLMRALDGLANRGYTEGFYRRHVPSEYQNYKQGASLNATQQFVGEIKQYHPETHEVDIEVKNRFAKGDRVALVTPDVIWELEVPSMRDNRSLLSTEVAPGSGHEVRMKLPSSLPAEGAVDYAMLVRHFAD